MIQLFLYNKCGTCRKAKKFLDDQGIAYKETDITLTPPTKKILKQAIKEKGIRKVFNTSGVEYRERKIKDRIKDMTEKEAIGLLSESGRLVKRPIVYDGEKITVGFDEEEFNSFWAS
jgi:arsenate reductase|tara:strand:+ start:76 stop:426 length:351 start_codon:yes stop_codon:yes gene_type:complete